MVPMAQVGSKGRTRTVRGDDMVDIGIQADSEAPAIAITKEYLDSPPSF